MLRERNLEKCRGIECKDLPLQSSSVTVEDILVTRVGARVGVLPESGKAGQEFNWVVLIEK